MSNQAISLEDLLPQPATFSVNGKEYNLRPFGLGDESWFREKFGGSSAMIAARMKQGLGSKDLGTLIYYFMDQAGRKDFPGFKGPRTNDEGFEVETKITGAEVMMEKAKPKDVMGMAEAFLKSIGISQPMIDKLEVAELKKNSQKKTKTMKKSPQTGA